MGYAGDNFVRYSGDTISMAQTQRELSWFVNSLIHKLLSTWCWSDVVFGVSSAVFAWEAYEKGSEVHLQADPTKLELLHQSYKVKKDDFKEKQKESILEKVSFRFFSIRDVW